MTRVPRASATFLCVWVIALAPVLLFPPGWPYGAVAVALLVIAMLASAWRTRQPLLRPTPFAWPLALLWLTIALGFTLAPSAEAAWPKVTSLLLGLVLLRWTEVGADTPSRLRGVIVAYLLVGLAASVAGLLGANLLSKFLSSSTMGLFPRLIPALPGTDGGVNPNAIGGLTLVCLPIAVALRAVWRTVAGDLTRAARAPWVRRGLSTCVAVLAVVLLVSQSRASIASAAVTAGVLGGVLSRRWRIGSGIVAAVVVAVLIAWAVPAPWSRQPVPAAPQPGAPLSFQSRTEIWQRAIEAAADHPVTGVGLNAFRARVHADYPLALVPPNLDIAHAHNMYLQTLLDVGIFGLIAYGALVFQAAAMCWRTWARGDGQDRALAVGLAGNLIAGQLFGVTDAVAFGAKIGAFFWWNLGLISALHQLAVPVLVTPLEPGATGSWTAIARDARATS